MYKFLVGGAAAAMTIAMAPAAAQQVPPPGVAQGTAPISEATPRMDGHRQTHMMMMSDHVMSRGEVAGHVGKMFARLDTNHDGFITREEVDALHGKMMAMGEKMDGMHDKMMNMHVNVEQRMAEHGMPMPDRSAMFDRLDTNHDGSISRGEYMAGKPLMMAPRIMVMRDGSEMHGAPGAAGNPGMDRHVHGIGAGMGSLGMMGGRLFEMADANHDGRVSLAEAQAAALAHFDRADVNHDGKITPDERPHMRQDIRIERRSS